MFRHFCFFLTAVLFAGLQTACSSTGEKWDPDDYTVKSGDTIYSIAWRYELDPEEFAAWNNLGSSTFIKPGQRLHTREPHDFAASGKPKNSSYPEKIAYATKGSTQDKISDTNIASKYSANTAWVKVEKNDTLYSISRQYGVGIKRLVQLNQLQNASMIQPGQKIFLKPQETTASSSTQKDNSHTQATVSRSSPDEGRQADSQIFSWPKTVRWQRPVNGKVIKQFNRRRSDAKGIDIAGKLGENIVASAGGKVVYSGNGLISYGKLIIIKHNETYLSAYAYNHKLLVKEGEVVKAGQIIAEMGRKDGSSPRLHFEIRKNGKPVDPLKYLS